VKFRQSGGDEAEHGEMRFNLRSRPAPSTLTNLAIVTK